MTKKNKREAKIKIEINSEESIEYCREEIVALARKMAEFSKLKISEEEME